MDNINLQTETATPSRTPLLIFLLIAVAIASYFLGQNTPTISLTKLQNAPPSPTSMIITPSTVVLENKLKWKTTNFMYGYSFEYPDGWHVMKGTPGLNENVNTVGLNVVIAENPIDTGGRDGSLDDVQFIEYSGFQNPEEKFDTLIQSRTQNMSNIQKKVSTTQLGELIEITGDMKITYDGIYKIVPVDFYFYMIPAEVKNDKTSYKIVVATIGSKSKNAPILDHILKSFQKISKP